MSAAAKQQVIKHEEPQAPALPASDTATVLGIIAAAARDPNVDTAKMRELMAMRKEIADEDARHAFDDAMTLAQSEMRPIAADANNPQTRSKYASYLALDRAMRPIYTKHGFSLGFNTADGAPVDHVMVICDVSRGGHTRRYQVPMPADGKGAKGGDVMTKTHAIGAAMTYGQRYLLKLIFNIAVGEDNDGNEAVEKVSQEQADAIRELLESTGASREKFLKWAKVTKVEDIPAAYFDSCITAINNAGKK